MVPSHIYFFKNQPLLGEDAASHLSLKKQHHQVALEPDRRCKQATLLRGKPFEATQMSSLFGVMFL